MIERAHAADSKALQTAVGESMEEFGLPAIYGVFAVSSFRRC